jgi:hypothetical protein
MKQKEFERNKMSNFHQTKMVKFCPSVADNVAYQKNALEPEVAGLVGFYVVFSIDPTLVLPATIYILTTQKNIQSLINILHIF